MDLDELILKFILNTGKENVWKNWKTKIEKKYLKTNEQYSDWNSVV